MSRNPSSIWFAPPGDPSPPSPRRARPETPLRALRKLMALDDGDGMFSDAPSTPPPPAAAAAAADDMRALSLTSSLTSSGDSGGRSPRRALPRTRVFCARAERGAAAGGRVREGAALFGQEGVWEGAVEVPDFAGNGRAEAVFWGAGGFLDDEDCDYVSEGDGEICLAPVPKQGMDRFGERARVDGERARGEGGERARGGRVDRLAKSCEKGIARRAISALRGSPSFGSATYGGGAGCGPRTVVRDGEVLRDGVVKGIHAKDFEDITRVATDGFGYGFGMREQRRGVLSRIGRRIGRLH